jgi:predicted AAA+ superfamily ATPase
MVIKRYLSSILRQKLAERPAVALLGSRQVGKTTLALMIGKEMKSSAACHRPCHMAFISAAGTSVQQNVLWFIRAGKPTR